MQESEMAQKPDAPRERRRSSIVVRLLAAFVLVSSLPIAVLAALSLQEAAAAPAAHQEGGEEATAAGHGTLAGIPIELVELGVAGTSLVLSVAAAFYIGRTIIRPIRSLEASMDRVETGDLDAVADVGRTMRSATWPPHSTG